MVQRLYPRQSFFKSEQWLQKPFHIFPNTQKNILPASSEPNSLQKQSFSSINVHMNTTSSPSFIAKFNVTTKESKLDDSHMY